MPLVDKDEEFWSFEVSLRFSSRPSCSFGALLLLIVQVVLVLRSWLSLHGYLGSIQMVLGTVSVSQDV